MADKEEVAVRWRVRLLPALASRSSSPLYTSLVEEFSRLERRIFPKHESLAASFSQEVKKRNQSLLYVLKDDEHKDGEDEKEIVDPSAVAGYLMYCWTSLAASITKLAVRDSCRRLGYGEALMQEAIRQTCSRRLQCVNLHVDPTRIPAVTLYEKLGFSVDAVVHSYYASDRDAYRMVLELCPSEEI